MLYGARFFCYKNGVGLPAIILCAATVGAVGAGDIRVLDASYAVAAYVEPDGRLLDASYRTFGFLDGETVRDEGRRALGYVEADGTIRDAGRRAVARAGADGRLVDAANATLGYVDANGRVMDASYVTVGFVNGAPLRVRALLAYLFFFGGLRPAGVGS